MLRKAPRAAWWALMLLVAPLCVIACGAGSRPTPTSGAPGPTIVTLLADNRLLMVRAADGAIVHEQRVAPVPPGDTLPTGHGGGRHALARLTDGRLVILLTGDRGTPDRVLLVDAATLVVGMTYQLDGSGLYRAIAVGPVSGHLYLFGYRQPASALVTVLDPASGATVAAWQLGRGTDQPAQIGVSTDERRLFLSYHNTGLDWYDIAEAGPRHCRDETLALRACLSAHGGFASVDGAMLVATGTPRIAVLDLEGTVRRGYDTALPAERHVAEFVVDPAGGRLYAVASCDSGGGFSVLDLAQSGLPTLGTVPTAEEWRWTTPPGRPLAVVNPARTPASEVLCGERLVLGPAGVLAVARPTLPGVSGGVRGGVLVIEGDTGRILRIVAMGSDPVDMLIMP